MKKYTIVTLTTLFAVSSAFALPAFKADGNKEVSSKVGNVLEQKVQDQKKETFVKVYENALAEGYFSSIAITTPSFKSETFNANVTIAEKNGKTGDIVLSIFAPEGTKAAVKLEKHYTNGISNDPHAAVELIVHVTINGKETKFVAAQLEAIELAYIVDYDVLSKNLPIEDATGKCPRCGAQDPYHCNESHTGPCVDKTAKPQKPAQEVIWEKKHDKDCRDEYHCNCPTVMANVVGTSLKGEKIAETKVVETASFKAVVFNTPEGISYTVTPKNDAELKVKVVTDSKRNGDPHQFLDTNLVIEELGNDGKVVKTTEVFIISRDATTF